MKTIYLTENERLDPKTLRERISLELDREAVENGIMGTEVVAIAIYGVPRNLSLPEKLPPWKSFYAAWETDAAGRPYVDVHACEE